ncbi:MAG: class II histone deacetylase [Gaiellales bacterium]
MTTGFLWHERYAWHNTGRGTGPYHADASAWNEPDVRHSENADGKRRFRNLLDVTGLLDQLVVLTPRPATVEEVCRFHTPDYVERIAAMSAMHGGDADMNVGEGVPFGRGSYEVALLAAGGTITVCDAIMDGTIHNGYALTRPPGHHALADSGMGFCIFGNAAIAAHHLLAARGLSRVAIVDWDVHHGNGTQAAFYDDPRVLTISLHQDNNFPPESGLLEETGAGDGVGTSLNVPLPPGSGNGAYEEAFRRVVVPALERFQPEFIIIASGFDASAWDPLGRQMVTPRGYGRLTRQMLDAAAAICGGRLALTHEGGYSETLVPFCGLAVMEELSGIETDARGSMLYETGDAMGYQDLQSHQAAVIDAAAALVPGIPTP